MHRYGANPRSNARQWGRQTLGFAESQLIADVLRQVIDQQSHPLRHELTIDETDVSRDPRDLILLEQWFDSARRKILFDQVRVGLDSRRGNE